MAYDLLRACSEVSEGRQSAPDLLGQHWVRPLKVEHAWYPNPNPIPNPIPNPNPNPSP